MKTLLTFAIFAAFTTAHAASIDLTFSDNSDNEDGFIIERSATEASGFAEIGTMGVDVTSFSDATAEPGQLYYYRVKAFNKWGHSGYTNVAAGVVPEIVQSPEQLEVWFQDERGVVYTVARDDEGNIVRDENGTPMLTKKFNSTE